MSPSSGHSSTSGELWGFPLMPSKVTVDILMPTGIYISVDTNRECGLLDLKSQVWELARDQPLFQLLSDQTSYIFVGITKDAKREEFYDEQRRICDIHLFQPVIKLVEAEGNREEKILKRSITQAIGMSVSDLDKAKDSEVGDFRRNIGAICKVAVDRRNAWTNAQKLISCFYPPKVESSPNLPLHTLENLLGKNSVVIRVWITQTNSFQTHKSVCVPYLAKPCSIISEVLRKKSRPLMKQQNMSSSEMQHMYVLKIYGLNEYLVGDYPISQYKYVRQCINRDELPDLVLENTEDVTQTIPQGQGYMQPKMPKYKQDARSQSVLPAYAVRNKFRVLISSGSYLNVGDNLYVFVNIYHGTTPLCLPQKTDVLDSSEAPKWNQWLEFDILVSDIPRGAKMCLSVCGVRRKKNTEEHWPLSWVNIPLYSYEGHLVQGKSSVGLWHPPCHMDGFLHPIGISGSNLCKDMPCLKLEYDSFGAVVKFTEDVVDNNMGDYTELQYGHELSRNLVPPMPLNGDHSASQETVLQLIMPLVKRDPLYPLVDEEKRMLWKNRGLCATIPDSLPKLLQSVQWGDREAVKDIYALVRKWKHISPEVALELLDSNYPDPVVRHFATKCLEVGLTDDGLLKYLLQLVTALKFETYLDSSLFRFLLTKSLSNMRIGHYLFWHLKSEMHNVQVSLRFGLFLEAYCRSCGPYLEKLVRQAEIVEKLVNVNASLQKDDAISHKTLRDHLVKPDYEELLQNNLNPLNPACELENLCVDMCEVKSSAKRPIILQWKSSGALCDQPPLIHGILFKNGDDLRQDMLTLQILRVMDDIWQNDNLDMCITPYMCISMGQNVGMIEIVRPAETIMSVQKKGGVVGSLQLRSSTLHQWLKDNNQGEKQYHKAVYNFTRSCAGYCVATMVLGIADRHNDNIMIKKNGQMFHIDFGHFLNHKKKKYGICRNRVPFVLPGDFMRIICRGATSDIAKTDDYKNFENLCCRAYLSLRSKAYVIINLLSMMLGAGIPELTCFDDIEYVRTSLALEKTKAEAVQYFLGCLAAAQNKQWTTKVDWVCHAVRHSVRK